MLTRLELDQLNLVGISLGGVYTSILVPELSVILDTGIAPRSFVGARYLFLSHGHADHMGALPALIGVRGLAHQPAPLTFLPQEIEADIQEGVAAFNRGQRRAIEFTTCGMLPGQVEALNNDLCVRAIRTLHSVPSLAYVFFRRVSKLKREFQSEPGERIAQLRREGADLFEMIERLELAYVTDSLIDVLDQNPQLYQCRVLILECTFLDDRKSTDEARSKGHVHLDEIIERAEHFQNEKIVLMHFSQTYRPSDVHHILKSRLPAVIRDRVSALCPSSGVWPG